MRLSKNIYVGRDSEVAPGLTGGSIYISEDKPKMYLYKRDGTYSEFSPEGGGNSETYYTTPEEYGAVGDGVTDDSSSIQIMFNAIGASDVPTVVVFGAKTYLINSTINIPRISGASAQPFKIEGYGATLKTTNAGVSIFRQMPADQTAASTEISDSRLTIRGITFLGDNSLNQIGIEMGAQYNASIQDCNFQNLSKGIIGTFCLLTVIDNCRFTNNNDNDLILQTAGDDIDGNGAVWTGGTISNSASNASIVSNCRFFGKAGQHSNAAFLASDQIRVVNTVVEGNGDGYGLFFDRQTSSLINSFVLDTIWFEGPSLQVNIKSSYRGILDCRMIQRTLAVPIFDAANTLSSSTLIQIELPYLTNLPATCFYHTGGDGVSGTEGGGNYTSAGNRWIIKTQSTANAIVEGTGLWENGTYPSLLKIDYTQSSYERVFSGNKYFKSQGTGQQFWLDGYHLMFPDNASGANVQYIGKRGGAYYRPRGIFAGSDGFESLGGFESITNGEGLTLRSPDGTPYVITVDNAGSIVVT